MAQRNSGYKRRADNWYVEEPAATESLLQSVEFEPWVVDPACGQGNVLRVCKAEGMLVRGFDIVDRFEPDDPLRNAFERRDWLDDSQPTEYFRSIICNPPYKREALPGKSGPDLAARFILATLPRLAPGGKAAFFLPFSFLGGEWRKDNLYDPYPPSDMLFFSRRKHAPPGGSAAAKRKPGGGSIDTMWLVWTEGLRGAFPRPRWIE